MNIRKFIAGVLACCIAGGFMPSVKNVTGNTVITANAVDYTEGTYEQLTYKKYSDYIEITNCDDAATEVVIPAEIEGLPVTSIGESAFKYCLNLTDITIPDSVTSIGYDAFCWCFSLTDITIPDSVTSIGDYAFYMCLGLTSITIPDSVAIIGEGAFWICSSLTNITIPDSVTSIGSSAFCNCSSLAEITIPDSVTSIGGEAFLYTPWLEEKQKENPLVIVNGILIDGRKCSGDVIIPDIVKSISGRAFEDCSSLTDIAIPDSVASIGDFAFFWCSSLTDITIPESVTSIGYGAFSNCSSLEKIVIENPECEIFDDAYTISNGYKNNKDYFNGTIYGYDKSTAQEYAEKYNREFVSLGKAPETAGGDALTGDANCDGTVDLADATAIIQHIGNEAKYGLSEQGFINADCTDDGKVTGADAMAIQKLEAGQITELPYIE